MTQEQNRPEAPDVECRPILFTEAVSLRRYPNFFRSTLVGLVGSAHRTALAGPAGSNLYTVLCPAVEVFEYPSLLRRTLRRQTLQPFLENVARFKPTILHGIWPRHSRLLARLSRELRVPFVLSFFEPAGKIKSHLAPWTSADGWITASEPISQSLLQHKTIAPERIVTIPPGCYTESGCACFSDREHQPSLVMIHPLSRMEDFEPLLGAVRHLLLDGFEFFLGILGSGRAESALRRRIRTLGLSSSISIVPIMETYRDVLCGADIFIRLREPGRYDPSLVQAMSVGLAVAGCPDRVSGLLQDGRTGVLFESQDELSIYAALKKLLSRPEWASQLAAAGQEYIRQNHQVSRMIDRLLETYLKIQQQGPENSTPRPATTE